MNRITILILAAIATGALLAGVRTRTYAAAADPVDGDECTYDQTSKTWSCAPATKDNGADMITFPAGSIIIPLDGCYQKNLNHENTHTEEIYGDTEGNLKCNGNSNQGCGIVETYGLMVRFMRNDIPVHWSIANDKSNVHDIDFEVEGTAPVMNYNPHNGTLSNSYSTLSRIQYRGAPFIIHADDAVRAKQVISTLTGFRRVDIHIAQYDFKAPVYTTLLAPPKLALLEVDGSFSNGKTNTVRQYTTYAGFEPPGPASWWDVVTPNELLADKLTKEGFQLLWVPSFTIASGGPTAAQKLVLAKINEFLEAGGSVNFFDGAVRVMEGYDDTFADTKYIAKQDPAAQNGSSPATGYMFNEGVFTRVWGGTTGGWTGSSGVTRNVVEDASDPMTQVGGMYFATYRKAKSNMPAYTASLDMFKGRVKPHINGAPTQERTPAFYGTSSGGTGRRTVMTYSTTSGFTGEDSFWSFGTWRYFKDDTTKGKVFYVGGDMWSCDRPAGLRMLFNATFMEATTLDTDDGEPPLVFELSRSTAITIGVDGISLQLQGTKVMTFPAAETPIYAGGDGANFRFPAILGHFRGIDIDNIGTEEQSYDYFDAKGWTVLDTGAKGGVAACPSGGCIPPANLSGCAAGDLYSERCRTVFTHTTSGTNPTLVYFDKTNAAALKPYLAPALTDDDNVVLIERILAGQYDGAVWSSGLGGIDRSTSAVVSNDSPNITNGRPVVAYVGGLDGMLHAICLEVTGACAYKGMELWAFIPRTQMYRLRSNEGRLDGSPRIADVLANFGAGKVWKTVLVVQTGSGDSRDMRAAPSIIALDVTDPTKPAILWERTTQSTGVTPEGFPELGDFEQGIGLTLAMGMVRMDNGSAKHMTFIQTNNGGKAIGGTYVEAVDTATGTLAWSGPVELAFSDMNAPHAGIPGGVAAVSMNSDEYIDYVLVPTLSGELWVLKAKDGTSLYGSNPLFRFSSAYHPIGAPPTIYRARGTSALHAVIVSGGYADANLTAWSPGDVNQYVVGFPIELPEGTSAPIDETQAGDAGGFTIDLGAGNRAFAQAIVAGNEIFVVTDVEDVNESGYTAAGSGLLRRYALGEGGPTPDLVSSTQISGGAASVDYDSGSVYATGGSKAQKVELPDFDANSAGAGEVSQQSTSSKRRMWLRLQ